MPTKADARWAIARTVTLGPGDEISSTSMSAFKVD
jgi:hypothetical protein